MKEKIRKFNTGATRDTDMDKLDYEGFISSIVLRRFAEYMNKHRILPNKKLRDSDDWQRGMPKQVYMKSLWRHFMDVWLFHRGYKGRETLENGLCGVIFNAMGYLHEILKIDETNQIKHEKDL